MNILIPVLGLGNAGGYRVLSKLGDLLINAGHNVDIICPIIGSKPYFPTRANVKWIDASGNLITEMHPSTIKKETALSIQQKLFKALSKISKASYDIVIANHSLTVGPIVKTGWKNKTLYYVQAYEPEMFSALGGFKNYILAVLSTKSYNKKLFTVVNADLYKKYKNLQSDRVLYPGIDFSLFYPADKKRPDGSIVIGTIGRKEKYKGTYYVTEAFKLIKKQFPQAELHIAFGDQQDFNDIPDVKCLKPKNDEELGRFYRNLDFYFCANFSQIGAFHYPIAEAMSCGVPVITTPYYPANENNAWLVRPKSPDDFLVRFKEANTKKKLKEERVTQALLDVKQFNWDNVGKKLGIYINEVISINEVKTIPSNK